MPQGFAIGKVEVEGHDLQKRTEITDLGDGYQ